MRAKSQTSAQYPSEEEIDRIVTAQAEDGSAWEDPIRVEREGARAFSIPSELADRAAFLAKAHRAHGVDEWLARVIRERIELEESAFGDAKRDLSANAERKARRGEHARPASDR